MRILFFANNDELGTSYPSIFSNLTCKALWCSGKASGCKVKGPGFNSCWGQLCFKTLIQLSVHILEISENYMVVCES